jgi:hypothetical protein
MACSAVLYFQGFFLGGELLSLGFFLTGSAMALWFRDCVIEGATFFKILHSIIFVVYQTFIFYKKNKLIWFFIFCL